MSELLSCSKMGCEFLRHLGKVSVPRAESILMQRKGIVYVVTDKDDDNQNDWW